MSAVRRFETLACRENLHPTIYNRVFQMAKSSFYRAVEPDTCITGTSVNSFIKISANQVASLKGHKVIDDMPGIESRSLKFVDKPIRGQPHEESMNPFVK